MKKISTSELIKHCNKQLADYDDYELMWVVVGMVCEWLKDNGYEVID